MTVSLVADKCDGFDKCSESGACFKVCALNAIADVGNMPVIKDDTCFDCGLCVIICPNGAL
ncbi:MAG: 4Fe-4S binding protein, partial [Methanosphaera sp.]|nr:4Fe-4S binding protein [Methanosphaera sp.]